MGYAAALIRITHRTVEFTHVIIVAMHYHRREGLLRRYPNGLPQSRRTSVQHYHYPSSGAPSYPVLLHKRRLINIFIVSLIARVNERNIAGKY